MDPASTTSPSGRLSAVAGREHRPAPLPRSAADEWIAPGLPPADVDGAHFDRAICRNCGAGLTAPFCGQCGQKKVVRFSSRDLRTEIWQSWRWFELDIVKAAWALATGPGRVAREYVLGARKRHTHPLKLLLVAVGLLLLLLSQNRWFAAGDANLGRAGELLQSYGKWSFSLGIVAVLASSLLIFRRRLGYNAVEHLVLATYCQFLILCAQLLNMLPPLMLRGADYLQLHKQWSVLYMNLVAATIVAVAFRQFFVIDLRREWPRLLMAIGLFVAIKVGLQRLYAWALIKAVMAQLS